MLVIENSRDKVTLGRLISLLLRLISSVSMRPSSIFVSFIFSRLKLTSCLSPLAALSLSIVTFEFTKSTSFRRIFFHKLERKKQRMAKFPYRS